MAQVTVEQLAETVGASVDRLLSQMKDAGLPHASADEAVSEEDKQTLLAHLKKSHGERAGAPKKITLKRKSVSTLRAGGAGKRTVNVEVRKKRTYVKREDLEDGTEAEAGADLEAADTAATADLTLDTSGADTAPVSGDPSADNDDPEMLRQRAAARRKAEEQARQLELEAAAKARAEEAARQAEEGAAQATGKDGERKQLRSVCMPRHQKMKLPRHGTSCVVGPVKAAWSEAVSLVRAVSSVATTFLLMILKRQRRVLRVVVEAGARSSPMSPTSMPLSSPPKKSFMT